MPQIDSPRVNDVLSAMTPLDLRCAKEFLCKPKILAPVHLHDFDDVYELRDEIRNLRALPVKTNDERDRYHKTPKEQLLAEIQSYFKGSAIAIVPNAYPYWLPDDLRQEIVWIANREVQDDEVATAIAKHLVSIPTERFILFERSINTDAQMFRGTLKEVRHIHLWTKVT